MSTEKTEHPLKKINWGILGIVVYKGCIISKLIGGYSIFGIKCKNEDDVDEIINSAGKRLSESITVDLF